jgi:V/A-type H+-transporting ATPase subunit I
MNQAMRKVQIIGLSGMRRRVLEALKRTGNFELAHAEKAADGGAPEGLANNGLNVDYSLRETLLTKLARTRFGIEFIDAGRRDFAIAIENNAKLAKKGIREAVEYEPLVEKKPLFFAREEIDYDNFQLISSREMEILTAIEELEQRSARLYEMRAEETKLKSLLEQLSPYVTVDAPLTAIKDTAHAFALLGTLPQKELKVLTAFAPEEGVSAHVVSEEGGFAVVFIAGLAELKEKTTAALQGAGFVRCPFAYDRPAADVHAECLQKLNDLYYERLRILDEVDRAGATQKLLKIYFDYISGELENVNAQYEMLQTRKAFAMWGWYGADGEKELLAALKGVSDTLLVTVRDPLESEIPPTFLRNSALVAPYESVTNMFSAPSPREGDPNKYVMFFFWLFFGLMVADVAYGAILFLLTLIVLKRFKLESGMKNLLMIVCMGGISAMLWGVFTGGWMGFSLPHRFFQGVLMPMENMMAFLGMCLGLGVVQIIFGLCIKLAAKLKRGKFLDALCDPGFLLIMFTGVFMWATSMIGAIIPVPAIVSQIGLYVLLFGLLGMMATAGRGNKGILKKLGTSFGALYGLVNYVGDILSYARLFGLCVASGVIASVANQLGGMLFGLPVPGVNYVLGVAVAAAFHAFNIALGVLSAYVHNSRLQFVEFFGKFYEGGGHVFVPMGSNTKYMRIRQI